MSLKRSLTAGWTLESQSSLLCNLLNSCFKVNDKNVELHYIPFSGYTYLISLILGQSCQIIWYGNEPLFYMNFTIISYSKRIKSAFYSMAIRLVNNKISSKYLILKTYCLYDRIVLILFIIHFISVLVWHFI